MAPTPFATCGIPRRVSQVFVALVTLLLSFSAWAGSISFELSLTGSTLSLTAKGDSTAFYPAVFRLLADGRWERLKMAAGTKAPAELLPGARIDLLWPDLRPLQELPLVERARPLMVRFFDQAGVSFGQLSFMHAPPAATDALPATYAGDQLTLSSPNHPGIRATWVLWPQEEGIEPIRRPVSFEHTQPPARRIEWQSGMAPQRMAMGVAQPMVMLVHEMAGGLSMQSVPRVGVAGRQQRSAWLDARQWFYGLSLLAAVAAVVAPLVVAWRGRASA